MQEQTRKRLTLFARLWAISMVLFIVLSVVAVIAGMDERKNLMGAAVVGTGVMLVLLLCQVIAAVVVRRWWCVVGGVIGVLVSIFVMLTSIVALGAGQYRPPKPFVDEEEMNEAADTAFFSAEEEQLTCSIAVPIPEPDVRKAVGEWLDEYLSGSYRGDKDDIQALVDYYGKQHTDTLRSMRAEGVPDFAELCYDVDTEKLFETDKIVTYQLTITINFGGAHPLTQVMGASFSKDDGRRLKWDILRSGQESKLQSMISEKLMDYFNVKTQAELMEYLQGVDDIAHLPLPVTPLYMTNDGFVFIYQQYEIAAYAMGMPTETISYRQIKPYLTDWAKELVPWE